MSTPPARASDGANPQGVPPPSGMGAGTGRQNTQYNPGWPTAHGSIANGYYNGEN